ncbi:MAG: RagB/SusD family nutrient uptake outer membrane protein [Bacteroidales bacterium]|nr:RagB/SusD family nutrient uptake outer membrane protein [Bacteroidales bacterium]
MKKISYALCTLAVLLMTACGKDFITAVHNESEPLEVFFNSEDRMYQGLVAAYDPLHWFDYSFGQYCALNMMSDIMADDIYAGGSNEGDQPVIVKTHYYTATPTDVSGNMWTIAYSGINRCCHVLEKVDAVPGMKEETKKLYIAEATILKAFYYTVLWKFWGNVPYYDQNLTSPYITEQLGHDEVYANIVRTIEEALALNVLPMKAVQEGRVTKAMAYMLYAEVVMYQNDKTRYQKALDYMKEIITSNKYSLVSDYAGIWEESGEWGPESIFEINYVSEGGLRDWGAAIAAGGSVYPQLIGIPGASTDFADGWGFSGVAKTAYDMYDEGDIRRDGGILNIDTYITSAGTKETCTPRWESEGFYLLKYIARKNGNHGYKASDTMNHCNNYRLYRYAETLLNAAELSVLLGQDGSSYLKEVRDRANCKDTGTDQLAILQERHKEFVGEGKRYWDLVRTGQAATVLKGSNHSFRTNDWTESKKYWPIPQSEIDKDPNLVQNNY